MEKSWHFSWKNSERALFNYILYLNPPPQMGKQTMGTPLHAYPHRADNKLYRIQTPQSPMVRTQWYDHYNIDEYPLGTNAVVAVISYTVSQSK